MNAKHLIPPWASDESCLHNPAKVTPEEVGNGFRLLLPEEVDGRHENAAQLYMGRNHWGVDAKTAANHRCWSYRIPSSVPWPDAPKQEKPDLQPAEPQSAGQAAINAYYGWKGNNPVPIWEATAQAVLSWAEKRKGASEDRAIAKCVREMERELHYFKSEAALWESRYNEQTALAARVLKERDELKAENERMKAGMRDDKNRPVGHYTVVAKNGKSMLMLDVAEMSFIHISSFEDRHSGAIMFTHSPGGKASFMLSEEIESIRQLDGAAHYPATSTAQDEGVRA